MDGTQQGTRRATGVPVAWGAATLAVPVAPVATLLGLVTLEPLTGSSTAFLVSPVVPAIVGMLLGWVSLGPLAPRRARFVRGAGLGLVVGALVLVPLVLLTATRPWLP